MTKFYMKWTMNPMTVPANPEERVKYWLSLLELVKADLKSGNFTDWGICNDSSEGNCFAEGYCFAETDENTLNAGIKKWLPYIIFDVKPVLTVDQIIANVKKAAAAVKK